MNPTIQLNSQTYRLARRSLIEQALGPSARKWQAKRVPVTTEIVDRPDVAPGKIPGEYIITWDTFSKGIWGDKDAPPGTYHQSSNVETRVPGRASLAFPTVTTNIPIGLYPMSSDPAIILDYDGDTYLCAGRFVFRWSDGAWTVDKDLYKTSDIYDTAVYGTAIYGKGHNCRVTDACVFDGDLIVAVEQPDGADDYIWTKSAGAWNSQSSQVKARYLTVVMNKLWKSNRTWVVTVGTTNHHFDWNYEAYQEASVKTCTVTSGSYDKDALATALQTAINATSNIIGTYTVQYSYATDRYKIFRNDAFTIIAGVNDWLDYTESADRNVQLTAGAYTGTTLAAHLQTKMNSVAVDNTYTVTYSTSTRKFTFTRNTGTTAFGMEWESGTHGSSGLDTHVGSSLGFSDAADDTGATTYTSDVSALNFSIEWQTGAHGSDGTDDHIGTLLGYLDTADDSGDYTYTADGGPLFLSSQAVSTVADLALGSDPLLSASWSSAINIGDRAYSITDLSALGTRLLVSKEEGLFVGDELAIFPNILPDIATSPEADNGKNTFVLGSTIYYPHVKGLKMIENLSRVTEVGPQLNFYSSINEAKPGMKPTAICSDGDWLYVATEPAFHPQALPDYVIKTLDGGVTYTSHSISVSDSSVSTTVSLDSFSTWGAYGDALFIGYSAPFYGIRLHISNFNTNPSFIRLRYWNGSTWTLFTTRASDYNIVSDYTSVNGITLACSQSILWCMAPPDWIPTTIDSKTGYFIRLEVSFPLSSNVDIAEIRVLTAAPRCYILAGRPGDNIWHTINYCADANTNDTRVTALAITNNVNNSRSIVAGSIQRTRHIFIDDFPSQPQMIAASSGSLVLPRHDGGMPHINKEWLEAKIVGRNFVTGDLPSNITLSYRANENTEFTTIGSVTTTPSVLDFKTLLTTEPTGYMLQPRLTYLVTYAPYQNAMPLELNKLQVRFRVLPTYKWHYQAILELSDGQGQATGGVLPSASIQLTNLSSAMGIVVTLIDPTESSKQVTVTSLAIEELLQEGVDYPVLLATVEMVEE